MSAFDPKQTLRSTRLSSPVKISVKRFTKVDNAEDFGISL
jgi:hypothetical protein